MYLFIDWKPHNQKEQRTLDFHVTLYLNFNFNIRPKDLQISKP